MPAKKPTMSITDTPIEEVHRYEGNPRRNAASVRKIADSIMEFGWKQPIVVDKNGVIIIGDGRYQAAELLRLKVVPVVVAEDLSAAKARALRIADNRIGQDSEWDDERLVSEIFALSEMNYDIRNTALEDLELAELLSEEGIAQAVADPDDLGKQNQTDEQPAVRVTVPGDIWTLGNHRIACGDSRSQDLVRQLLAGARPQLMVTDPPYGVNYDASWRVKSGLVDKTASGKVANDNIFDWRQTWALFPGKIAYIYHANLRTAEVIASLKSVGFELRNILVWVKQRMVIGRGHYHYQHEPVAVVTRDLDDLPFTEEHESIAYLIREGESGDWQGGRKQSTVWEIPHVKNDTGHSTQKPVEAMRRPILNHTNPGEAVYEPFSGSGSTLIAAETCKRICYAVELMPEYVDIAVRRWQSYTGKKAKLVTSDHDVDVGKTFDVVQKRREAELDLQPKDEEAEPAPKPKSKARAKGKRSGSKSATS